MTTKRKKKASSKMTWRALLYEVQGRLGRGRKTTPGLERLGQIVRLTIDTAITEAALRGQPVVIPGRLSLRVETAAPRRTLGRDGNWYEVPERTRVRVRALGEAQSWAAFIVANREGKR